MTRPQPPHQSLVEDTFALAEGGHAVVALPETLSKAEYEELRDWLELMRRKAERKVADQSSSKAADSERTTADDDDSLSWE